MCAGRDREEDMLMNKPRLFIGSASEGLEFARAIRSQLDGDAEVVVWNEAFEPGTTFIESLVAQRSSFDFAVFVFSTDDWVSSRETEGSAPRDNVIFELGLFMGTLGRERTVIVRQAGVQLKHPTDLSGVTIAEFEWPRQDKNPVSALGKAGDGIRRIMVREGLSPARLQQRQQQLESDVLANRKQIQETRKKVDEQQAAINKLVETSMSDSAFRHLAGIYLLREYLYLQNSKVGELFRREFYFLKNRGFIGPETLEFDESLNNRNLAELAFATEAGKTYIDLRKSDIPSDWLSPEPRFRKNLKIEAARSLQLSLE